MFYLISIWNKFTSELNELLVSEELIEISAGLIVVYRILPSLAFERVEIEHVTFDFRFKIWSASTFLWVRPRLNLNKWVGKIGHRLANQSWRLQLSSMKLKCLFFLFMTWAGQFCLLFDFFVFFLPKIIAPSKVIFDTLNWITFIQFETRGIRVADQFHDLVWRGVLSSNTDFQLWVFLNRLV